MIIKEKLNNNTYLGERENAGWNYRTIVRTSEELEINKSYSRGDIQDANIHSLCFETQNMFLGGYNDMLDTPESLKELCLSVLIGEDDLEWAVNFAKGNGIIN